MSVVYQTGDLFTTEMPAIGHGVNTKGLMGAGIAVLIRKNFPDVYEQYKEICNKNELAAGDLLPIFSIENTLRPIWVLNLASQDEPGANASLQLLESSLIQSFDFCADSGLEGFALPRIGAGIGGLEWEDVKTTVEKISEDYPEVTLEMWSLPDAE